MKRYYKYLVNLAMIAIVVAGIVTYNYVTSVQQRHSIHSQIMERLASGVHWKELKPVNWEDVKSEKIAPESLNGKSVVFAGYGKPTNPEVIRDLGSVAAMGMDPCCPKPISYRRVTALELSPLPYHCYFSKQAPVKVDINLAPNTAVEFVADSPSFYRGTLEVREEGGRKVVALKDAEKVDTSKGSVFSQIPTPGAAAAAAQAESSDS